jgi:hypothetical protein
MVAVGPTGSNNHLVSCLQNLFRFCDLFEDFSWRRGPSEWFWVCVCGFEVCHDSGLQFREALESPHFRLLAVISAKKRSTMFSQDDEVGVKCMWNWG